MTYEDDVFISYSHIDNQLLDRNGKGWIDNFHFRLGRMLGERLGREVRVWRDTRLPGTAPITKHLIDRLSKTKILLSVVSPGYMNSEWCCWEVNEFCNYAGNNDGLIINGKCRAIKILKTQCKNITSDKQLPIDIDNQIGFSFFKIDSSSLLPDEFDQDPGENKDKRYWNELSRLAWEIKSILELFRPDQVLSDTIGRPAILKGNSSKGIIYLAETTSDMRADRLRIKGQLEQLNYTILPDHNLPTSVPEYEELVLACLEQSIMSVHLVGAIHSPTLEGAVETTTQAQIRLATTQQRSRDFKCLIWHPANSIINDTLQQKYLDELQNNTSLQEMAEYRIEFLEDLTRSIVHMLQPPFTFPSKSRPPEVSEDPVSVYLLYEQSDQAEVRLVEDYLFDNGYEVHSNQANSPTEHNLYLQLYDSVLIYLCNGSDDWLAQRRADLIHARGLRKGRKFYAKAFYLSSPPDTECKRRFRSNEAIVLKSSTGFDPDQLSSFFFEISQSKGARG